MHGNGAPAMPETFSHLFGSVARDSFGIGTCAVQQPCDALPKRFWQLPIAHAINSDARGRGCVAAYLIDHAKDKE